MQPHPIVCNCCVDTQGCSKQEQQHTPERHTSEVRGHKAVAPARAPE
jgi:hypothetical protein